MSPASNILCVICTENFEASDTIYNTSCGHVFHENCIKHWRGRSTECPVCRARYANMQKLFLNFDENAGSASAMDELQTKLESCESNMDKLYKQLNDGEVNFMRLQGQYTLALEDINLLNGQLSKRNDSENNFMALQKQYTEAEDIIKNLKDKNQYLLLQCEEKNKEIQLKTLEISTLKDTMGCMETSVGGSDSILKQQLKIMEQKLRHITGE
ncbi:E3 ubiquitin-protein ligase TRAIP-like, partial [Glossina fuscipes]|uniref:E3 ubiquitin-protein ligase TRAIP-like n=1 Tax=Glossina fuscipes TaxID=7396 RepID=A0A9C5ZH44_9MUSC